LFSLINILQVHRRGCETATTGEHEGKSYLSVSTVKEFWEIYKRDCQSKGIPEESFGSLSTFRAAYEEVKDTLRLQGSAVGCSVIATVLYRMNINHVIFAGRFQQV
jgi:hypothetical protein